MTELVVSVLGGTCCVYLTSAVAKLRSRSAYLSFRMGLAETKLVQPRLLPASAAFLAGCEALVSVSTAVAIVLVAAGWGGAATACAATLGLAIAVTGALVAGIAVILRRGTKARCACFGAVSGRLLGGPQLARNSVLLAATTTALICSCDIHGQASVGGAVVATMAGAVTGLLLIRLDDIVELFSPISTGSAG
jgi:hypothetical protein